jgi:zinc transport system substrate-binding protein
LRKYLLFTLFILAGCGQDPGSQVTTDGDSRIPLVYTVNYPLYWMADQLAGSAVGVVFAAPATGDPAFWKPDVATLLQYQQADLVLLNGANYAKWIANASLFDSRLVDTSAGYRAQLIAVGSDPQHSHGPQGEHSHGELAFTTWLNLDLAQRQAQAVAAALQGLLPPESAAIEQRLTALRQTLQGLDGALIALGKKLGDTPLLYSHPVYQYLQQRYQFNGRALHWEPDQLPDSAQWQALAQLLASHPAQLMLWEDEPLPEVVQRLAAMGIQVVVFSPLGNRPQQGDFSSNLAASIAGLEAATN